MKLFNIKTLSSRVELSLRFPSSSFPSFTWERTLLPAKFHFAPFSPATLKGLPSLSPGLSRTRGTTLDIFKIRPNPARVESIAHLGLTIFFFSCVTSLSPAQTNQPPTSPAPTTNAPVQISAPAQVDPFSDPLIKQIEARHEKAVNGDTKETKALTADLEKWTEEQPTNYLLQAYLGSVYTLDSRDSWPGPGKLSYLRKGAQWLDAAVISAPDNPAIRFIRAMDYFMLPAIFGKRQTARDDFKILLKQIDGQTKSPYLLSVETQQAIYYYAGLSAKQLSQEADAKDAWVLGYKLDQNSVLGKKIGDELMKVK